HAESHACETDDLHSNAPVSWDDPNSDKKTEQQKQIDCSASSGVREVTGDDANPLGGDINRAEDNRSEESDAIGGDIHQEPGNGDQHRTSSIGAREENCNAWFRWRDCTCDTLISRIACNL